MRAHNNFAGIAAFIIIFVAYGGRCNGGLVRNMSSSQPL
jgi:hypothetical protein